jgi:hypothetical protein
MRLLVLVATMSIACGGATSTEGKPCDTADECSSGQQCVAGACQVPDLLDASTGHDAQLDAAADPSCLDETLNGTESDVDCGGTLCPACSVDQACAINADCGTAICGGADSCIAAESCLALRNAVQPVSGLYVLDVDGPLGGGEPFTAYCDMDTSGGGWTLVMKLSTSADTLKFAAPQWTTTQLLNSDDNQPNTSREGSEAKYQAFNSVPGEQMHLEWREPADHRFQFTTLEGKTVLELFQGGELPIFADESGDPKCPKVMTEALGFESTLMRHGRGHQFFGINGSDSGQDSPDVTRNMRFGFASNDETYNSWFALQAMGADQVSLRWMAGTDCNNCGCYGNLAEPLEPIDLSPTSANLWIR